jgi:hypothetical protein
MTMKPPKDVTRINPERLGKELAAAAEVLAAISQPDRLKEVIAALRTGDHDAFHKAALKPFPLPRPLQRPVCLTVLAAIRTLVSTIAVVKHWYWTANNPFGQPTGAKIDTTSSLNPDDAEKEELYNSYVSQGWATVTISFDLVREPLPITRLEAACLPRR